MYQQQNSADSQDYSDLGDKDEELSEVEKTYKSISSAETAAEEDPWIRTRVVPKGGSSAFGPAQVTMGKAIDYADRSDQTGMSEESVDFIDNTLVPMQEKMLKYGGKDMKPGFEAFDYGGKGDFKEEDKAKYEKMSKEMIKHDLENTDGDKEKFLKKWRGKEPDKGYIKRFMDTFDLSFNPFAIGSGEAQAAEIEDYSDLGTPDKPNDYSDLGTQDKSNDYSDLGTPEKLSETQLKDRERKHFENDPMAKLLNKSLARDHKPLLGYVLQDVPRATKQAVEETANPLVTAKVLGGAIQRVPAETAAAIIKMSKGKGGADVLSEGSLSSKILQYAKEASQKYYQDVKNMGVADKNIIPFVPIKIDDVAQLSESMAYSIASMGTGLGVGLSAGAGTALIPGGAAVSIPVAWTTGTSASGLSAYNMSTYSIMQSFLESANEKSVVEKGREITAKEQEALKKEFDSLATQYGLWEAVPEAISNLAFASIIGGPLAKVMGQMGMKGAVTKVLGGAASLYGEEMATEMVTQYNQARIEEKAGLRDSGTGQLTWFQALKEVAPQTFLLSTILGGTGATVVQVKEKVFPSLKKEIGEEAANDVMAKLEDELDEEQDFAKQLDDQAEMFGQKVEDLILKQFESEQGPSGVQVSMPSVEPQIDPEESKEIKPEVKEEVPSAKEEIK